MSATKGCFATLTFYEENDTTFAGCVVIVTDRRVWCQLFWLINPWY